MATTMDDETQQYGRPIRDSSLQPSQDALEDYRTNEHKTVTPPALCSHHSAEYHNLCQNHHQYNSNSSSCAASAGNEHNCDYSECNDEENEDEEVDDCGYDEYEIYDTDCLFRYVCAAGVS